MVAVWTVLETADGESTLRVDCTIRDDLCSDIAE
jgi:hypothetical protein